MEPIDFTGTIKEEIRGDQVAIIIGIVYEHKVAGSMSTSIIKTAPSRAACITKISEELDPALAGLVSGVLDRRTPSVPVGQPVTAPAPTGPEEEGNPF